MVGEKRTHILVAVPVARRRWANWRRRRIPVDGQCHFEDGLAIRLVPAGEGPAGIDRFELGRGDRVGLAGIVGVGGPVEPPQLVVEGAGEPAGHVHAPARGESGGRKMTCSSSSSNETVHPMTSPSRTDLDIADGELGRIEHDPVDGFVHRDIDRHSPREGGRADVRLNLQPVDVRLHGPRQTERILVGVVGVMGKMALPGRLPASLRVGSRCVDANESAETPGTTTPAGLTLDLVAIGSPLLDVLETTHDEVLAQVGLVKGSMTLIDLDQATAIQAS